LNPSETCLWTSAARKLPGAEEDLCMPVILQLLLACLSPHAPPPRPCSMLSSIQFPGQLGLQR